MRKLTTQEFIDRARAVHGDKYDYSESEYDGKDRKLKIVCRVHGLFLQSPHNHCKGQGCPTCGGVKKVDNQRKDKSYFITKAISVHGTEYDYSNVIYIDAKTKVLIECRHHGLFEQTPDKHSSGNGCPSCRGVKISLSKIGVSRNTPSPDVSVFINKALVVHKNKYDYSNVVYSNCKEKVLISCPIHGSFEQTPDNHISGKGCPGCGEYGFDRTREGYIYLLRSECGQYAKIGITHKPKQRHTQLTKATPFPFHVIECIQGSGAHVVEVEKKLLDTSEPTVFSETFDGSTEWRLWSRDLHNKLLTFMS